MGCTRFFLNHVRRAGRTVRLAVVGSLLTALAVMGVASCRMPSEPSQNATRETTRAETSLEEGWPQADRFFQQKSFPVLQVALPAIENADKVGADQLCMTCHETYYQYFQQNVHRNQSCEDCHGPASRHLETRGREAGLIFNFHKLPPAQSAELCLKCHEKDACEPGARWRVSVHAHNGVTCVDCHTSHYNVPPGTEPTAVPGGLGSTDEKGESRGHGSGVRDHGPKGVLHASVDTDRSLLKPAGAEIQPAGAQSDHDEYPSLLLTALDDGNASSTAQTNQTDQEGKQESLRGTSNNLAAVAPDVCICCHKQMRDVVEIAGPHQVGGPNGFNCTTCHDSHGNIRESSRTELCLDCHKGAPTMAWHTSTHSQEGVACTDCHNPHPDSHVQRVVDIRHTNVRRQRRRAMAVQEPETCYKCHADVYGQNSLPSHHPIREGKVVCSDCHDGHGQFEGNLKEASVNQVCYRCHAEVQGPFVYEHPPVTQDCTICHEPHGTVENNLLRQPTTFLCLRCHSGHRTGPTFHDSGLLPDIGMNPDLQRAFFSDCTQCHSQIHGSDLPSPHNPGVFAR